MQNNGVGTNCVGGGCVLNFIDTPWKTDQLSSGPGNPRQQSKYRDSHSRGNFRIDCAHVGHHVGPAGKRRHHRWFRTLDKSIGADCGTATPPGPRATNTVLANRLLDSHKQFQVVTTAGTSGSSAPSWKTTPGATTTDGTLVTWTNAGSNLHRRAPPQRAARAELSSTTLWGAGGTLKCTSRRSATSSAQPLGARAVAPYRQLSRD